MQFFSSALQNLSFSIPKQVRNLFRSSSEQDENLSQQQFDNNIDNEPQSQNKICDLCSRSDNTNTKKGDLKLYNFQCQHVVCEPHYKECLISESDPNKCPLCHQKTILQEKPPKISSNSNAIYSSNNTNTHSMNNVPLVTEEYVVCDLKVDKSSSLLSQSSEFAPLYVPQEILPDTYIPFLISKETCRLHIQKWLQSFWFAPSFEKIIISEISSYFVPFYSFTFEARSDCEAEIMNSEDKWVKVNDTMKSTYHDVLVLASHSLNSDLFLKLLEMPNSFSFHSSNKILQESKKFRISDLKSDEILLPVEIQPLDASEQAKSIAIKTEQEAGPKFLKQKYAADQIRNVSICHHFFGWKHTISLLPVYRATYTYEGTEHLIYLSGVTGALQAVRPKRCYVDAFHRMCQTFGKVVRIYETSPDN